MGKAKCVLPKQVQRLNCLQSPESTPVSNTAIIEECHNKLPGKVHLAAITVGSTRLGLYLPRKQKYLHASLYYKMLGHENNVGPEFIYLEAVDVS